MSLPLQPACCATLTLSEAIAIAFGSAFAVSPCVLQGTGGARPETLTCPGMDLMATARKMAVAFTSGESQDSLAAALEDLLPFACYVRSHLPSVTAP